MILEDELQAEMVRSLLEAHGISSVIRRPALGEIQWGAINTGMGGAREVIVASFALEQARALVSEDDLHSDPVDAHPDPDPEFDELRARSKRASPG